MTKIKMIKSLPRIENINVKIENRYRQAMLLKKLTTTSCVIVKEKQRENIEIGGKNERKKERKKEREKERGK